MALMGVHNVELFIALGVTSLTCSDDNLQPHGYQERERMKELSVFDSCVRVIRRPLDSESQSFTVRAKLHDVGEG